MTDEVFHVVAQCVREHETRSMLDGQIHNIEVVGNSIRAVKNDLEAQIGRELHEVCIAAAGRVLKTVTIRADMEFPEEVVLDGENVYSLDMLGVEKAYEQFQKENEVDTKFYCVGYTVVNYYLNDYPISTLEQHTAKRIAVELIATFLPDEVVDGLYRAVESAGLQVSNLTLEPIAAMQVAIPVMYRMLNIALVDVGAGTSDICVTSDGSIIAYGMIPMAGDELTEVIAKHCLVDFATAERIKTSVAKKKPISYKDIMGTPQKITPDEVLKITMPVVQTMTKEIAEKIKYLNGGKSVAAVFVVGGGGKLPTFTECLAKELGIDKARCALRGEEVLKDIDYQNGKPNTDSLFVTPIGICLNFYDSKNNFIFVNFNGERIKLYDNGHLLLVDAALQAGFPNEGLFPRRGDELSFTVDGKAMMVRGELGEPAVITLNGAEVNMNTEIRAGDRIVVKESTKGEPANMELRKVPGFESSIYVNVNGTNIELPRFAEVNGNLQSGYYDIKTGDEVKMLDYYTVRQVAEFMDVILKKDMNIYVNNKLSTLDDKVYNNFSLIWSLEELELSDVDKYGMGGPEAGSFSELSADEEYKTGDAMAPEGVKRPSLEGGIERLVSSKSPVPAANNVRPPEAPVPSVSADAKEPEDSMTSMTERRDDSDSLPFSFLSETFDEADAFKREEPADTGDEDETSGYTDQTGDDADETAGDMAGVPDGMSAEKSSSRPIDMIREMQAEKREAANAPDADTNVRNMDPVGMPLHVTINGKEITLTGKKDYIFVDIFDFYDFDLSKPKGRSVVTRVNGMPAQYAGILNEGDKIDLYWGE
ncbi:MAG: rod shape-determining protein [Lachnospiraceae bacterium]|nr:rod shape-determining protein [Lachnospiraceae bacterium]